MPYLVQRENKPDEWETLYSEETALKADLLMLSLIKTNPLAHIHWNGFPFFSNGYRVAWVEETTDDAGNG